MTNSITQPPKLEITFGHNNQRAPIIRTSNGADVEILFPLFHDPLLQNATNY
jgi:hypothetical protein